MWAGPPWSVPPGPLWHTCPGRPGSGPAHSALWPSAAEPRSGTWAGGEEDRAAETEAMQSLVDQFQNQDLSRRDSSRRAGECVQRDQ